MNQLLENMINTHVLNTQKTYAMDTNENLISEIHPEVAMRLCSVKIIVGLGVLNTHHLFAYVTKDSKDSDKTFLALKPFLMILYVVVSEKETVEFMKKIVLASNISFDFMNIANKC